MKTPIALYLTDTHLKESNQELIFDIFEQAVSVCKENDIDRIFHAGDFFTSRTSQSLSNLLIFGDVLEMLKKNGITIFGIAGNHDKTNQDSERSYLDIFRKHKNFTVIRGQEVFSFNGVTVGFLPYFTKSYTKRLKTLEKMAKTLDNDSNILITHIAFNGAVNNDGSVVDESVKTKSVRFWDKVLVGHYHDSNSFKNIIYTGSSYQSNFGERLDDKGFQLIYNDASLEFIPSKYPKYIKVKLEMSDDIENEIELYENENGDNLRFIFQGDKHDLHKVDRQKLDKLGIDVKFEFNDINEEILKIENAEFNSMSKKSIIAYFKEYCKIQEIDKRKFSKGLKMLIK